MIINASADILWLKDCWRLAKARQVRLKVTRTNPRNLPSCGFCFCFLPFERDQSTLVIMKKEGLESKHIWNHQAVANLLRLDWKMVCLQVAPWAATIAKESTAHVWHIEIETEGTRHPLALEPKNLAARACSQRNMPVIPRETYESQKGRHLIASGKYNNSWNHQPVLQICVIVQALRTQQSYHPTWSPTESIWGCSSSEQSGHMPPYFFWGYIPELMEGTKSHVYTRKDHPNNNESPLLFHEITIFRLKVMSKINVHSYFLCIYIYDDIKFGCALYITNSTKIHMQPQARPPLKATRDPWPFVGSLLLD